MTDEPAPPTDAELLSAGLLEGLAGQGRRERLDLLRWLLGEGFALADLERATATETLVLMASERAIGGGQRFTEAEVASRAGVTPEFLRALERANGLRTDAAQGAADSPQFTDIDVQAATIAQGYMAAGLSEEQVLTVARVIGRGFTQIAEHMRQITFELVVRPGLTELELAQNYRAAAEALVPSLGPLLETTLRLHLRQAVGSEVLTAQERTTGDLPGAREVVVAFADLVGFTRMGEEVPPAVLGDVAGRLEDMAGEVIDAPVRVVKTIGDAVLLVSTDAPAMVEAALRLVEVAAAEGEDFPQLRVGIASGLAVNRSGDWFGAPVNLASRVTGVARAGSVLATNEVADAVPDGVEWSLAGAKRLKNVASEVRVQRARRPAAPAASEPPEPGAGRGRRGRR
ncbi:pH-sensitive adenylate cyclase [Paraconexibacter sp. AEG42_29]|uniref:PH-sensitive adenylate cyclase n=1 Tax=Paraconexibacter sp. AEG42_29 TaxID=2997339 RepID=A0AAU7AW18_9ACTN